MTTRLVAILVWLALTAMGAFTCTLMCGPLPTPLLMFATVLLAVIFSPVAISPAMPDE